MLDADSSLASASPRGRSPGPYQALSGGRRVCHSVDCS